ncbi:hypothetical protein FB446DRAFT_653672, partial [Lentinula raphanica]
HTLVQYSGSLTGRDFRVIAQIAPFIIHDLKISDSCREAWLALSRLVPLIWQPEIDNIDEYMETLEHEIDYFLLCVARWTSRWFNKPKFHIIIHLALHIRRFGPAMLFATEAFESFNAVIRAKSVHSNRQAPSRDIALAFAQGNRIRHLLSQGLFYLHQDSTDSSLPFHMLKPEFVPRVFTADSSKWNAIGPGPLSLVSSANTMTHYLGLDSKKPPKPTGLVSIGATPLSFGSTRTGSVMPLCNVYPEHVRRLGRFRNCSQVVMADGSPCPIGSFFIARDSGGSKFVGQLAEVLVAEGTVAALSQQAGSILVHVLDTSSEAPKYRMPRIVFTNQYMLINGSDMLCAVNVQHHCIGNNCHATATRPAYQERSQKGTVKVIEHQNPHDLVLNTCQMRNAALLTHFRNRSPTLDANNIITSSIRHEIDLRKVAKRTSDPSHADPPRATLNQRSSHLRFQLFNSTK